MSASAAAAAVPLRKRWPFVSREDYGMLVALDAAGRSDIARVMENLMKADSRREKRQRAHEVPLGEDGALEALLHSTVAGGGRRRGQERTDDE